MELEQSPTTMAGQQVPAAEEISAYWDLGKRYARKIVGCEADSDEIVQEVFYRLLARPTGEAPASVPADASRWIGMFIRSIRNLCIDRLRQRRVRATAAVPLDGIGCEPPAPALEQDEGLSHLRGALAQLPDSWKTALLLRAEDELSYDEIAERMGASKAQVRTWIFRARRQLLQDLGR